MAPQRRHPCAGGQCNVHGGAGGYGARVGLSSGRARPARAPVRPPGHEGAQEILIEQLSAFIRGRRPRRTGAVIDPRCTGGRVLDAGHAVLMAAVGAVLLLCSPLGAVAARTPEDGADAAAPSRSDPAVLPAQIRRVLSHHEVDPDSLSIYIHEVGAPGPAFTFNAAQPRNPASTMKVVTTYAALEMLGPGYRWHTELVADGAIVGDTLEGDLIIRAGGDPYLVAERLWLLQRQLRLAGVRAITGDLVFEDRMIEREGVDPGAFDRQPYRTYNVQPNSLMLNFQSVVFRFRPDPASGGVDVIPDPPLDNLRIDNRLALGPGPCGGYQRGIAFDSRESVDELTAVFVGTFPSTCERYAMRRAFKSADLYNYGLFKAMWEQAGGTLSGGWRRAEGELDAALIEAQTLVRFPSPSLAEVIRSINKHSNNVMARHLMITLGAERFGQPGSRESGVRAIEQWLAENGLGGAGLRLDNGAGLSRVASISAEHMGAILLHAHDSLFMAELIASMPIAAIDGTLRRRFDRRELAGRAHMKTGSLDDVSALAGFVTSRSARQYVVVVMLNHPGAHRGPGEEVQDALIGWVLAREPGDPPAGDCAVTPLIGDIASTP
jgi:D-alanyl-D-alanine carboxypeptidase/D-alanyl-D-alanine-endopeptidase (penicillin-binding protein 4)